MMLFITYATRIQYADSIKILGSNRLLSFRKKKTKRKKTRKKTEEEVEAVEKRFFPRRGPRHLVQ